MNFKKIIDRTTIAIVIFAIGAVLVTKAFATQQSRAKFTGGTFGATDTVIANANFLVDSSVSIGAFWMPPSQTYTLTNTGTNVVTVNNSGDAWKDSSTGAKTYPSGIIMNGASGAMKLSGSSGLINNASCALTLTGTNQTGLLNRNNGFLSWTLAASAKFTISGAVINTGFLSAVLNDNSTLTVNASPKCYVVPIGSTTPLTIGTGVTINGNGGIYFSSQTTGATTTIPAFNYTGTGSTNIVNDYAINHTYQLSGNFNSTGNIQVYNTIAAKTNVFDLVSYNLTTTRLYSGSLNATATTTLNFGSGTHTINIVDLVTYNTGTSNDNLQTCTINCGGDFTYGSNHTVSVGTSTVNITNTSTVTTANKHFWNLGINAATKVITFVNRLVTENNFTITAGRPIFAASSLDTVVGDWINNLTSTDTCNFNNDLLNLGGSYTGNLRVKNHLRTNLYSTALCNFTSNGSIPDSVVIKGTNRTKQMKPIDRYRSKYLTVTTGTLNTNGMDCFADSFLVVQDSIATVLGDTISSRKITFGASAKPINGTPLLLYFGLALADTMRDSITQSLGKLVVNKTGSNLTFANTGKYDTIQVINGSIAMNAATDTQYCKGLSITTTSTCVLTAPIVVTDSIYIAAAATVTYSGVGKIIKQTCSAAQGGNSVRIYYPTIGPIDYASSPWIDTVGKTATHTITFGGCTLGFDSVVAITALPTGYSIAKTGANRGLISWDGTGVTTPAGTYTIRAYSNAKTDWASVDVNMEIYTIPSSRRRGGGALNCGLLISTE